jgi:hypothetical protein
LGDFREGLKIAKANALGVHNADEPADVHDISAQNYVIAASTSASEVEVPSSSWRVLLLAI